jgi:hypothetical protein
MQTRFLSRKDLWPAIKKQAQKTNSRRMVATPYVGKGAAKLLPLRKGDVLICALTEANAKSGNICPSEIERLQERGIRVYMRDALHAKIYFFGRTAVVCSANLSQRSESALDEAGLLTSDPGSVTAVREWFRLRMGKPVTPGWLSHCQGIYKPPPAPPPPDWESRVWMIRVREVEFPRFEEKAERQGCRIARKRLHNSHVFDVERIRWPSAAGFAESVARGDSIIQIWDENGQYYVCPHGTFLHKTPTQTKSGGTAIYVYLEMPRDYSRIPWDKFQRSCREFGLFMNAIPIARQIKSQALRDDLLALVSPDRLMR